MTSGLWRRLQFRRPSLDRTINGSGGARPGIRIGTTDGFRAVVETRGSVQVMGRNYRVEWWVGGDDRWYAPATEAAVRQTRPGIAPVVETRMRVHGADIVATTWAAQGDGGRGPAVVVELANESAEPVAVALTVQPASGGQIRRLQADGRRLLVDGVTAVVADREPGRFALVDARSDLWNEVVAGRAVKIEPDPVRCRTGLASGALIMPLPHRSSLRFAVPARDFVDNPSAVIPVPSRVAAGWASHLEKAARVDCPEFGEPHRLLVDLILADPHPDGVIELARWGLAHDAADRLSSLGCGPGSLRAAAGLWALTHDKEPFTRASSPRLDDMVRAEGDNPAAPALVAALASLFEALDDPTAAADARLTGTAVDFESESIEGDDPASNLRRLASRLVRTSVDGLDLLPTFPDAWLGQSVEVHNLATPVGSLGYAIRWHEERPALLWELERHTGISGDVFLRVPGLDAAFSTTAASGEALLASPAGRVEPGS